MSRLIRPETLRRVVPQLDWDQVEDDSEEADYLQAGLQRFRNAPAGRFDLGGVK